MPAGIDNRVARSRRYLKAGTLAVSSLLLVATSACGGGSAGTSGDDATITVVWNSTPDIAYLPLLMAVETLEEKGYNVETKTLSGADVAAQALASNKAQFTSDNITGAANAIDKGAPIKAVLASSANEAVWVTSPGHKDCASLEGESVGIFAPAASSGYTKEMDAYFAAECPGTKPKLVTIPDSSLRAQALANGQLDGTVLALSDAVTLTSKLDPSGSYDILSFRKEFPGLADNYLFANDQILEDNPELVTAFVEAELEAVRKIYKNPNEVPQLLDEYLGDKAYPDEVGKAAAERRVWYANGGLNDAGLQGMEDTLDLFELPGSSSDIVDEQPLADALEEVGSSTATNR